jgi:hypothetical protein
MIIRISKGFKVNSMLFLDKPGYNYIYKSKRFLLYNLYETVFLYDYECKVSYEIYDMFYGDPQCGVIFDEYNLVFVGGNHLIYWIKNCEAKVIGKDDINWVHDIKMNNDNTIKILTDPWSKNSAIWLLDIKTLKYKKVRDFNDYVDRDYTEHVVW